MFTGIVETQGEVISNQTQEAGRRLMLAADFADLQIGESIAVNGVCLTLLPSPIGQLHFDVSPETLQCTTLGQLARAHKVNLERAMCASTRFGGHYVSGHVDTMAVVHSIQPVHEYIEMSLGAFVPEAYFYLIPKGSITVEGVSLTINAVDPQGIKLMLVPHTLLKTTLGQLQAGQQVNIEFDYLTRIVAHQLKIAGQLRMEA